MLIPYKSKLLQAVEGVCLRVAMNAPSCVGLGRPGFGSVFLQEEAWSPGQASDGGYSIVVNALLLCSL